MFTIPQLIIGFLLSFVVSILATPLVKKFAIKIGAVDQPDHRKVHKAVMPRLGGAAIVIGSSVGFLYLSPYSSYMSHILVGAAIILVIGFLDDKYTLSAGIKMVAQLAAAVIVVQSGLKIDFIALPFEGILDLGPFGYVVTVLWIVGITNAINLIDGLDGLAGGISTIAFSSMLIMAIFNGNLLVISLTLVLIGSTLGFLVFNFHPAKIFMGDTGALFLGYAISIVSLMGFFKSVTLFSFIIPVIILAVPIFDTFFAILRRIITKKKISDPDKSHLHHCLLSMGYSHRSTVLIIYGLGGFFGISAVLFSNATLWGSFIILGLILISIQLTAEVVGLIGDKRRKPLINTTKKIVAFSTTIRK